MRKKEGEKEELRDNEGWEEGSELGRKEAEE